MRKWQLQEAKAKLSELVKRAEAEGPQAITVHGKPAAVVVSQAEYENLLAGTKHRTPDARPIEQMSLFEFLQSSPLAGADLDIERDKSPCRDIEF